MTRRTRTWLSLTVFGLLALDLAALAVAVPVARAWLADGRAAAVTRAGTMALRGLERAGARGLDGVASALSIRPTARAGNEYTLLLRTRSLARSCASSSSCPYAARRARLVRTLVLEATCSEATGAAGTECNATTGDPATGDVHAGDALPAAPGPCGAPAGTTGRATSGRSPMGLPVTGIITTVE
ncbi:MAG TPA: hypothetical protein VI792_06030 [Candidatus Eisenbacteria bacterium]